MKYLFAIFLVYGCLQNALVSALCTSTISRRAQSVTLRCTGISVLRKSLDKARSNTTRIIISDSKIRNIEAQCFARFGATLVSLDMHESGIQVIDPQAFLNLVYLQELILWGNKLTWVPADWFLHTYSLKTLDVSFNSIQGIDYQIFPKLPYLQNFYFDYNEISEIAFNLFPYLYSLKKVKFGKNPWKWPYRARLTWQMEDQNVDYSDDWEDWSWMSSIIKDCIESGQGEMPKDTVLDCAVKSLLDFARDTFVPQETSFPADLQCYAEASQLVRCMRPKNITGNTDYTTVRMILEDYARILPSIQRTQSVFKVNG